MEQSLKQVMLGSLMFLADDGTYLIALDHDGRNRLSVVRIDMIPSPHITARFELGMDAHHMCAVASTPGLVALGTTESFRRVRARRLLVLDERLNMAHSQPMVEPWAPVHAIQPQCPLVLLTHVQTGDWQIVSRESGTYATISKGIGGGLTGAIAPDGKSIVMSVGPTPRLALWSVNTGKLIGEYLTQAPIVNLCFSTSGEYLSVADPERARLIDYRRLLNRSSESTTGRDPLP